MYMCIYIYIYIYSAQDGAEPAPDGAQDGPQRPRGIWEQSYGRVTVLAVYYLGQMLGFYVCCKQYLDFERILRFSEEQTTLGF